MTSTASLEKATMKDLLTGSVKEISLQEQDTELARLSSDAISHFDSRSIYG